MRVIKPHSLIALFAVPDTSLRDQKIGKRVSGFFQEHPGTSYVGAEADDWPTFRIL